MYKKWGSLALAALILFTFTSTALAGTHSHLPDPRETVRRLYASNRHLTDWEAILLGINGIEIQTPLFATPYFRRVENDLRDRNGIFRLATDYARIILVYISHGRDPANAAGFNLVEKLIHFEGRHNQGLSAYIWSLIALFGQDTVVTDPLIQTILTYQRPEGWFSLTPVPAETDRARPDIDLTAMAVTALAPYAAQPEVQAAIDSAVAFLAESQALDGTFGPGSESISQVIIALSAAGVDIFTDARFITYGSNLLDALAQFRLSDGRYAHNLEIGQANDIATRQVLLALSAVRQSMLYEAGESPRRGIFELTR